MEARADDGGDGAYADTHPSLSINAAIAAGEPNTDVGTFAAARASTGEAGRAC